MQSLATTNNHSRHGGRGATTGSRKNTVCSSGPHPPPRHFLHASPSFLACLGWDNLGWVPRYPSIRRVLAWQRDQNGTFNHGDKIGPNSSLVLASRTNPAPFPLSLRCYASVRHSVAGKPSHIAPPVSSFHLSLQIPSWQRHNYNSAAKKIAGGFSYPTPINANEPYGKVGFLSSSPYLAFPFFSSYRRFLLRLHHLLLLILLPPTPKTLCRTSLAPIQRFGAVRAFDPPTHSRAALLPHDSSTPWQ